jgi:FMN phosphatase YigB (HAD superfamily)
MSVVLFDIDGTLTPGPDPNHQAAVVAALDDVFDVP